MKEVDWDELGGAEIANDDWKYQTDGLKEMVADFSSLFGSNYFVSGGGTFGSGNPLLYVQGVVCLNGEILPIANAVIDVIANPFVYVEPKEDDDPLGAVVFENGTPHNIYKIRTAEYKAYSTAQAGKVLVTSMKSAYTLINEMTNSFEHVYTTRQTFKQGLHALFAGNNTIGEDNISANVIRFQLSSLAAPGTVPVVNAFSTSAADGTIWVGCFDVATIVKPSLSLLTPSNKEYLLNAGDVVVFTKVAGFVRMMTNSLPYDVWHTVGDTGEPAFQNGWAGAGGAPVMFRLDGDLVSIIGNLLKASVTNGDNDVAFVLPSAYRPKNTLRIPIINNTTGGYNAILIVNSNGNVNVNSIATGAGGGFLGSVVYSTK